MAQDSDSTFYREPYRPQFHYSPPCQWMNDPNGMVYYEGEYHLFYQFHPESTVWGPMHWGHAVSTDLVHWQTLPIALYPDAIGPIWSGSAVVDHDNTSGLVPGGGLVAIFTYQNQSQGIAYSHDKGRTWTMYEGNPVIPALAKDFRDPKVIWHPETQHWVMILAAGNKVQIFTSPNLRDWELASDFVGGHTLGIWEVPDLFPLTINGQTKWVLLASMNAMAPAGGGGVQYFIGEFDGKTFTSDYPTEVLWLDYGPDNYAGTTWDNEPQNRRVYIGWLSNWQYAAATPTTSWRGAATLPRELTLVETSNGLRLRQLPVDEFTQLRGAQPLGTWDEVMLEGELVLDGIHGRKLEIIAEFELPSEGAAERFGLDVQRGSTSKTRVIYNTPRAQLLISRPEPPYPLNGYNLVFGAPLELANGQTRVKMHLYVDESSVEVFAQDGLVTLSSQMFADPSYDGVAVFAENGSVTLKHLEVYRLSEIWSKYNQQPSDFSFCANIP